MARQRSPRPATWDVRLTGEAQRWYMGLPPKQAAAVGAAFDDLERRGPVLARPRGDSIKGARYHNMKEARSVGGNLRALLVFNRSRQAIVLVGGDKTNDWKGWYKRYIPRAEELYAQHLRSPGKEVAWPEIRRRAGGRSVASGR